MARTFWMTPVFAALTAALAAAQGDPNDPLAGRPERFLSVQEVGRPPLRCKLLKSWVEPGGSKAYQVQAVATGEMLTILESGQTEGQGPGDRGKKAAASRIVHWGVASHPPTGTPEAPPNATLHGRPIAPGVTGAPAPYHHAAQSTNSFTPTAPIGGWPAAYANRPTAPAAPPPQAPSPQLSQAVPAQSPVKHKVAEETRTPARTIAAGAAAPTPNPAAVVPPGPPATRPAVAVVPAPSAIEPSPYGLAPTAKQSSADKTKGVATTAKPEPAKTSKPAPGADAAKVSSGATRTTAAAPKVDSPAVPTPPAIDWHQSWGKGTQPKSVLLTSAAPPPAVVTTPWPVVKSVQRKVDPLQDPESYMKVPAEERAARKLAEKAVKPEKPVGAATSAPSAGPAGDGKAAASTPVKVAPESKSAVPSAKATVVPVNTKPLNLAPQPVPAAAAKTQPKPPEPHALEAPFMPGALSSTVPPKAAAPTVKLPPPPPLMPAPPVVSTKHPTEAAPKPTPAAAAPPPPARVVPVMPAAPPASAPSAKANPAPPALPAYITAAAVAAADNGGNAFSRPRTAPTNNSAGGQYAAPPPVPRVTEFGVDAGVPPGFSRIPAAPPVIAAAPSQGVVAAGFPVTPPAPVRPVAYEKVSPALEAGTGLSELLTTLHASLYPSQREWAADRLTACDWRTNPQAVEALVRAARNDPAPLVRVGCLRSLSRMRATCDPAVDVARDLRSDADARVRQEAENTLASLVQARSLRRAE